MSNDSRPHTGLTLNEQSLVSYKYDTYSGAQVSVYIDDIWVDDVVSIQFTITEGKAPVYGYNSKYYDVVAGGNRIIQGQLAIAYTEEGYLTTILNKRHGSLKNKNTFTSGNPMATSAQAEATGSNAVPLWTSAASGVDNKKLVDVRNALKKNKDLLAEEDAKPMPDPTLQAKYTAEIKRLEPEYANLVQISVGNKPSAQTYTRNNIQALLGDARGRSAYEDLVEVIEDAQLDPAKLAALQDSWMVVESPNGGYKIRKALDFDLEQDTTENDVPYSYVGRGFDVTILYGDFSSGAAEHTIKTLTDVHFTSESQIVEANGNPILEIYTFIAKDAGDLSRLYNPGSPLANNAWATSNATKAGTQPSDDKEVTELVLEVAPYLASGLPGTAKAKLTFPALQANGADAGPYVNKSSFALLTPAHGVKEPNPSSYPAEPTVVTLGTAEKSEAYNEAYRWLSFNWNNVLGTATHGYHKLIKACGAGAEKTLYSDETAANKVVDYLEITFTGAGNGLKIFHLGDRQGTLNNNVTPQIMAGGWNMYSPLTKEAGKVTLSNLTKTDTYDAVKLYVKHVKQWMDKNRGTGFLSPLGFPTSSIIITVKAHQTGDNGDTLKTITTENYS